jgi:ribose/xylose/arabinose/galactoside ABC-type transport system permease subunit
MAQFIGIRRVGNIQQHAAGGVGTIYGTFVASFIIGAINAGIVAIGMSGFWTELIYGLIIAGSTSLQTMVSRRLAGGRFLNKG